MGLKFWAVELGNEIFRVFSSEHNIQWRENGDLVGAEMREREEGREGRGS